MLTDSALRSEVLSCSFDGSCTTLSVSPFLLVNRRLRSLLSRYEFRKLVKISRMLRTVFGPKWWRMEKAPIKRIIGNCMKSPNPMTMRRSEEITKSGRNPVGIEFLNKVQSSNSGSGSGSGISSFGVSFFAFLSESSLGPTSRCALIRFGSNSDGSSMSCSSSRSSWDAGSSSSTECW